MHVFVVSGDISFIFIASIIICRSHAFFTSYVRYVYCINRTLVEFDTPGHTRAIGSSHPELLTACEGVFAGKLGPFDPTKEETYTFMEKILSELVDIFPDEYVHLGGDEGKTNIGFSLLIMVSIKHIRFIYCIQLVSSAGKVAKPLMNI